MSQALDYLVKTRGDALGHYFAFLRECGKHLDPKTRNLISVITKVDAQTERGLRQYLKRALKEGCTPLEVLDALLMAFPTLGLAKIVWAVDIILAMDLPGFDATAITAAAAAAGAAAAGAPAPTPAHDAAPAWHDLIAADALAVGETRRVDCDGRGVFVHHGDDGFAVFDSVCPHQTTDIPATALQGHVLTCPRHQRQFDLRTGACTARGDAPLKRWPSRIHAERVQAQW